MIVEQLKQMAALFLQVFRSPVLWGAAAVAALLGLPTPIDIWFFFKLVPWSSIIVDFFFTARLDNLPFTGFLLYLLPPPTTRANLAFDAMLAQLDFPVLVGFTATMAVVAALAYVVLIHFTYEALFGKPAVTDGVIKVIWQRLPEFGKLILLTSLAIPVLSGFLFLALLLFALFLPKPAFESLSWAAFWLLATALIAILNMSVRALLFNYDAKNAAKDHSYTTTEQTSYGTSTYSYQNVYHFGYGEIDRLVDLGLKIIRQNFKLTLLVFALSWVVDMLKLVAAYNGLIPYGWLLLYLSVFGRNLGVSSMTMLFSVLFVLVFSVFAGWQALLWTHLYFTKKTKDIKPAPEKQA